jgi:hypothetical protein
MPNELTPEWFAEQRAICEKATPGPWDDSTLKGQKIFAGNMTICDIRGWGYLTGAEAMNLPEEQAIGIQEANAALIAAARTNYPLVLEELEKRMTPVKPAVYLPQHSSFHVGDCVCGRRCRVGTKFCADCGRPLDWSKEQS